MHKLYLLSALMVTYCWQNEYLCRQQQKQIESVCYIIFTFTRMILFAMSSQNSICNRRKVALLNWHWMQYFKACQSYQTLWLRIRYHIDVVLLASMSYDFQPAWVVPSFCPASPAPSQAKVQCHRTEEQGSPKASQ